MAAHKAKKNIPAYVAIFGTIFLLFIIVFLLIIKISGEKKDNSNANETGTVADTENKVSNSVTDDNQITSSSDINPDKSDEDWALYVIGNNNPLPSNFTIDIKTIVGERTLDKRCADYAIQMLKDAKYQGVGLYVTSAYRSIQYQADNLQNFINRLMAQGYTEEEATIQAKKEIALPGCSEHNSGLALDIVSDNYWSNHDGLYEDFENYSQFKWLVDNSWKYGFILSYPKGKEDITGFIYEPWHYRFVGLKHAEKIHEVYEETGEFLTVNEYIEQYVNNS